MPLRKWFESANHAINGILHAAKTQRHMRYHMYASMLVLIFSLIIGVRGADFLFIVVLAIMVIAAEMLNTAIEDIVNILFKDYDQRAKAIKDIAAGAVLITSFGAAVIGYIILFKPLRDLFYSGLAVAKQTEDTIAVISLIAVLIMVVITKSLVGRGTPLKGGMPSGHAAVAFSVWVAIIFLSENFLISSLVLLMAVLIAQSRIYVGIHKPWEVILGALLGSTITFALFKIFS
ncbi:MAG: diacylglycerol kinase [Nitrospirota bacterium]